MTPHVIHATNGWASYLLEPMRTKIIPVRATMSAQRPGMGLEHSDISTLTLPGCNTNGDRTYVFYDTNFAYDYLTRLPTPQHELMFGGGLATGGIDELGSVNDANYCVPIASHLSGALAVHFGERHWGEEARPGDEGEGFEESRWNKGRVKALWSGIEGASADELPWVGRVPPKVSGRKQPAPVIHHSFASTLHNDKDGVSTTTDPPSSSNSKDTLSPGPRITLALPGEWIAAGYTGEGMVHGWMSGKALAHMVLGKGEELNDWFPDIMRVTERRWKRAKVENLIDKFL